MNMSFSPAVVSDLDGITTYTVSLPVSFTGTLIFGVGLRDETARSSGLAHLVEHLVMHRVGKVNVAHNAITSDESISFFAQGPAAAVGDFLMRVGQAIRSLHEISEADVAGQRRIIVNELGDDDEYPGCGPLVDRFGNQTIGLINLGSPAHRSHTRDDVLRFTEMWLHAGNAALTFTGEVPAGFSLDLPAAREVPPRGKATPLREGAWAVGGHIPLTITVVLPTVHPAAFNQAHYLLMSAFKESLRDERGLIYSIKDERFTLDAAHALSQYEFDPRPEYAIPSAMAAMEVMRHLAEHGPTKEQMSEQREQWTHAQADPMMHAEYLGTLAVSILRGHRDPSDTVDVDITTATADDVKKVIASAVSGAFITFGENIEFEQEHEVSEAVGLPAAQEPQPYVASLSRASLTRYLMSRRVRSFSARLFKGVRGQLIAIDDERVTCTSPFGLFEVRFDAIVLATYSQKNRFWTLVSSLGTVIFIDLHQWRGSRRLHAVLQSRVPRDVQCAIEVEEPVPA